jgi:hypothetical protein
MSQVGDGTVDVTKVAAAQAAVGLGFRGGSRNPFGQISCPPSIHGSISSDDSISSDEDEGGDTEAIKRRKKKMKAKIEKKAEKLMMKRIKEENEKHPFFGLHQVLITMHYLNVLLHNFNRST